MKEERPVGWTERLVVNGVLAFALAAVFCGLFVYPLYQEVVALRAENQQLKSAVNRSRADLRELHLTRGPDRADVYRLGGGAVPDVRTKVVDVRPETGHVALGAGKNSGIKEGFFFIIHRGDEYIGKVKVTTVWSDYSGGTVVERKKPIKAGDDAMTDTTPGRG